MIVCKKILLFMLIFLLNGCDQKDNILKNTMNNMVFVKGGTFEMGDFCLEKYGNRCAISKNNASLPTHSITLDSYYMGKYKITYKDYDLYSRESGLPKLKIAEGFLKRYPKLRNDEFPATANWQLSKDYCQWLGKKSGLPFDLPTEAQWEYAARNRGLDIQYGTKDGHFTQGVTVPTYAQIKEYAGFSAGLYPVGKFPPNPLGLYDMAGNGQEWMRDWFSSNYYQQSPSYNPIGPNSGTEKSLRGFPAGDSLQDDATPTATTIFRTGKDPLLKRVSLDILEKSNGDPEKLLSLDPETNPQKIAIRGFVPTITFRCVINAQSLPENYR